MSVMGASSATRARRNENSRSAQAQTDVQSTADPPRTLMLLSRSASRRARDLASSSLAASSCDSRVRGHVSPGLFVRLRDRAVCNARARKPGPSRARHPPTAEAVMQDAK